MNKRRDIPAVGDIEQLRRRYDLGSGEADLYARQNKLVILKVSGDDEMIGRTVTVSGSRSYALIMGDSKTVVFTGLEPGSYRVSADGIGYYETVAVTYYGVYETELCAGKTYGVDIDMSNSNPSSCVVYTDDAAGMTPGSADFDTVFAYKPCLFKDGRVVCYLDPNDFGKDTQGNSVDITSGASGDVMVEFPRRDIFIGRSGDTVSVKVSTKRNMSGFSHNAHRRGNADKNNFYIGAYPAYTLSQKMRSLSGKIPSAGFTIAAARETAHAAGSGYELFAFYQLTYLQALYVLKYKNLNCQSALGRGYVAGSQAVASGTNNSCGMCCGTTSETRQMKLFGIEDLWGNVRCFIEGIGHSGTELFAATDGFNNDMSGYTDIGAWSIGNTAYAYFSKVIGSNAAGFLPAAYNGSYSIYFCDYTAFSSSAGNIAATMYGYNGSNASGIFNISLAISNNEAGSNQGARLMYL